MADFCLECTFNIFPELLPTGENDLAGLCEPGEMVWALCEGCGEGWFDFTGQHVTTALTVTPSRDEILPRMSKALAAVQAAQTAMFALCQVSDLTMWANGLNELYLLKHNLDTELALAEDAQSDQAPV